MTPSRCPAADTSIVGPPRDRVPYGRARASEVRVGRSDSRSFTFYLPGARMLGTVWLDDQRRIRRVHLVNPGHEIEQRFAYRPR